MPNKKTIDESEKDEKIFFENKYPTFAYKQGRSYLRKILGTRYKELLTNELSQFRREFTMQIISLQESLNMFHINTNREERVAFILEQIQEFSKELEANLTGNSFSLPPTKEICGATIRKLVHEDYKRLIMDLKVTIEASLLENIVSNSK